MSSQAAVRALLLGARGTALACHAMPHGSVLRWLACLMLMSRTFRSSLSLSSRRSRPHLAGKHRSLSNEQIAWRA